MASIKLDSGFLLLYDWLPAFESLSGEDFKGLFMALLNYQKNLTPIPSFENPICNIFAQMIEPTIKKRLAGQECNKKAALTEGDKTVGATPHPSRVELSREKLSRDEESGVELSGFCGNAAQKSPDAHTPRSANASFLGVSAAPSADTGSLDPDDELSELIGDGISESYVNERRYRAEDYARTHNRRISSVLREWWEQDKSKYSPSPIGNSSFDTDDFFNAAVEKMMRGSVCPPE